MSELDDLDSSKIFMINEETIAEAFLEYYNKVPFINIYVDLSIDMYVRLHRKSDTITIFKNLNRGLVKSLIKNGFACNNSGSVQMRVHLN
jgi:hypothetical protein